MMGLMVEMIRVYYTLMGVAALGVVAILAIVSAVVFTFSGKRGLAWAWAGLFLGVIGPGVVYLSLLWTGLI